MKKILFIVPMHITLDSFLNPGDNMRAYVKKDGKRYNSLATDLPLGLLSMSAYLKSRVEAEVKLIDFNVELNHAPGFPFADFFGYCENFLRSLDFVPDVVGVSSLFSPSFDNFMACGKAAKAVWPQAIVLGGGNIPTNGYRYIYGDLGCESFDALCYGEGEKPLAAGLAAPDMLEHFERSPSWITRKKLRDDPSFAPKHDFIEDLDEIPFYDYGLCDITRHGVNPATPIFHQDDQRGFHIMTSRGCPFLCTFCAAHRTHGREMRYHSLPRIKADLSRLKNDYGAKTVIFQDDNLMADRPRILGILEIIGELKLRSLYQNGLNLYALDRPMLEAFHAAGVRNLVLPVESGSERVLNKLMRKPLKFDISERVSKDCRDLGIYTNANIIIGMPGETKADIEEARLNLRRVKSNWFNIACASPLVGSEMHEIARKKGYIRRDTMGSDFHKAVIETEEFSSQYIQEMQYVFNLELNYVHNNDVAAGEYDLALRGFLNAIRVRPDHAFAHYYAAICFARLGNRAKSDHHREQFASCSPTPFWRRYCERYNLSVQSLTQTIDAKAQ